MSTTPLSFGKAHYEGDPAPPDACVYCSRELPNEYFRVNQHLACAPCAQQAESLVPPDSHKAFSRGVLFGVGAAVLGCIVYAMFEILTGIMLGWIAIGVGFAVGWAMKRGSGGLGGRRYQITAALLTYAAVAIAFIPVAVHQLSDKNEGHEQTQSQSTTANDAQSAENHAPGGAAKGKAALGLGGFIGALLMLLGLGLISPFMLLASSVASGLLNLFIIFLGIRQAWTHTASPRPQVDGPFGTPNPA